MGCRRTSTGPRWSSSDSLASVFLLRQLGIRVVPQSARILQTVKMAEALDGPPKGLPPTAAQTARSLVDALSARHGSLRRSVFVALDGRSGAGKSTLATVAAESWRSQGITVTVIGGDDFYAGGTAEHWDQRSPAEKAHGVIDWQRQHRLLEDLRLRGCASWHPFDWESPVWDADPAPLRSTSTSAASADIVILEGAYSARPELHDMLDMLILLDTPPEQRRRQLLQREGDHYRTDWEARWSAAEDHYFGVVMPPTRFDLVL
jgi:uridine kinase